MCADKAIENLADRQRQVAFVFAQNRAALIEQPLRLKGR
jgi:hypothetical protein